MRVLCVAALLALFAASPRAVQDAARPPIEFVAAVQMSGPMGDVSTTMTVHIDSYTEDRDRTALLTALKRNGYQAFLPAFRKVPIVGRLQIKDNKWDLRWTQRQVTGSTQVITVATDKPVYFVGGGNVEAKPRAGYELSVVHLDLDLNGVGTGTFAPAARVKPNADVTGVEIIAYGNTQAKITSVKPASVGR